MRHLDADRDPVSLGYGVKGALNLPRQQLSDPIGGVG